MSAEPPVPDRPRITVIGTGYLGATHAACMAELGFEVLGRDVDEGKIATLSSGRVPFFEPGLEEMIARHVANGRLRFTTSVAEVAEFGDVHYICVGTPQRKGENAADTKYVDQSVAELAPLLTRRALVVGKSTVPVGTAARLAEYLSMHAPSPEVELAWSPEFLREGFGIEDTLRPTRVVFGVRTPWAERMLRASHQPILEQGTPLVVCDFPTAELVKVSANSFLAVKISFINAIAEVCEACGADVITLAHALALDPRIGGQFLRPGLGFGGGCLPKDIRAFMARAGELGVDQALTFLREVDAINYRRRARVVDLAREFTSGTFGGTRVACLGAAFKPNCDDVRDSPSLDVAVMLQRAGGWVKVYDPKAMDNARERHPELAYAASVEDACTDADIVILLTEWPEFCELDPEWLAGITAQRNIVDGRNALDPEQWCRANWHYRALGRPHRPWTGSLISES